MLYFIVACWLKVIVILNLAYYIDSCCMKAIHRGKRDIKCMSTQKFGTLKVGKVYIKDGCS